MEHHPNHHSCDRPAMARAGGPSSQRAHWASPTEAAQPSSRHSTPLPSAREAERSSGGAGKFTDTDPTAAECKTIARGPPRGAATPCASGVALPPPADVAHAPRSGVWRGSGAASPTCGSHTPSSSSALGSPVPSDPPTPDHAAHGPPSSSWRSLRQIPEHLPPPTEGWSPLAGGEAQGPQAGSSKSSGGGSRRAGGGGGRGDAGVTLVYTPRPACEEEEEEEEGAAHGRAGLHTGSLQDDTNGAGPNPLRAAGAEPGASAGVARSGLDSSGCGCAGNRPAKMGAERERDAAALSADSGFGGGSPAAPPLGAEAAGGLAADVSAASGALLGGEANPRTAAPAGSSGSSPVTGGPVVTPAGPGRSPSQQPVAADDRPARGSPPPPPPPQQQQQQHRFAVATGHQPQAEAAVTPSARRPARPSAAAGPSLHLSPSSVYGAGAAGAGAAPPRASPFVNMYGAAPRRTPPPGAYSSASTRLALHDVLSHRSHRSRLGAGAGLGGSVSVSQLGGNTDFRPRWRY